jgi:hypothetical protein
MKSAKIFTPKIIAILLFGIAFGYIEAAVVIYLRQIYSPEGFNIPFYPYLFYFGSSINIPLYLSLSNYLVEILREAATMIVLVTFSYLAGKQFLERLAIFLFTFAVWDIFYYTFLFLIIRWPPSLLTMDILFLIPVPWLTPVIMPITASLIMIGASIYIAKLLYF